MSFVFDTRPAASPLIEAIWHTQSEQAGTFTSTAASYSEIVVTRLEGKLSVTLRGPETKASAAAFPAGGEFFGIVFKLGTFMPQLPPRSLIDRSDHALPVVGSQSFWLDNTEWEIPTFENADLFVARLVRKGLLTHDPLVRAVLQGAAPALSPRALQYRFVRATGLSHSLIQQIERAQQAFALLQHGASISDTAYALGYFDQAHLGNALKRFFGQTPGQIARL